MTIDEFREEFRNNRTQAKKAREQIRESKVPGNPFLIGLVDLLVKILPWLYPRNIAEKHDMLRDRRLEGSGSWFLHTTEFKTWKNGVGPNLLLCPGMRTNFLMWG
jgi:hypothetical protein